MPNPSPVKAPTLHERLRQETRGLHDALEIAVAIEHQIASRGSYASHLTRLWRIHAALEERLAAFDPVVLGFDYRRRRRSALLAADLAALGWPLPSDMRMPHAFAIAKREHALGCIYVVEGSSLGARAILPQIERTLGLTARHGASFFEGFGERGKPLWRACLAQIDAITPTSGEAQRVIDAAEATFRLYMEELPPPAAVTRRDGSPASVE